MPNRYRYAAAALRGRWHDSRDSAIEDAIRVRLAHRPRDELVWRVPGRIEEDEGVAAPEAAMRTKGG
jgi:hypothetical protein